MIFRIWQRRQEVNDIFVAHDYTLVISIKYLKQLATFVESVLMDSLRIWKVRNLLSIFVKLDT